MTKIISPLVAPITVQSYLNALIAVYTDSYLQEVEQVSSDVDFQSSFEALARRAVKAHEALIKHPDLSQDIYEDFKLEFQVHNQEIASVMAARQHV